MKNSKFKDVLYPVLSLFFICLFSVLLLAVTNELTKDKIARNNKGAEDRLREVVFPDASSYNEKESYVECLDKDGGILGYIFVTAANGYGGEIKVMTGIDSKGVITNVKVISHTETPSIGGKAIDEGLADEYKGKTVTAFEVGKNIDGLTGATRTAKGIADAVNKAAESYSAITEGGVK